MQIFKCNDSVRFKMEPPCGREGHQSQPDARHDTKKCVCVCVASKITRELAYTFVRPHLEYASVVWSAW